jgi:hypothetical protein
MKSWGKQGEGRWKTRDPLIKVARVKTAIYKWYKNKKLKGVS